jgi:hypothetical protein
MEDKMTNDIERQVIELIATDRIDVPISSMSGKLKRAKPKLARALGLSPGDSFEGERVYASVAREDTMKARGMREGIEQFKENHPRYGKILDGYIEEERANSETHVYFGLYDGCRLTQQDYLTVMQDLGFSEGSARALYAPLMEASRNLTKKRNGEERSVLIG